MAEHVAADLGIDEVHAELLPADKVAKVEELLKKKPEKGRLCICRRWYQRCAGALQSGYRYRHGALWDRMPPSRQRTWFSWTTIPLKIAKAIRISRKCLRIVYENIWFAIGIKMICLLLGAVGIANMWLAIFADVGVMIIAVLNAIRALFVKGL